MVKNNRVVDLLTIIAWNIYIGTGASAARTALKEFRKQHRPEVFALMEASNLYGDLEGLGYQVFHMKPKALRPGNRPGQGNIAILVRNDVEVVQSFAMRMRTFWIGPKHGWEQDPRVYRWVKIRWQGKKVKLGVAHVPFGEKARTESRNRLIRWFRNTMPGRPTILVLDANMRLDDFEKQIADPVNAEASGHRIDLEAHKNAELKNTKNLGKGVSDHVAMMYEFAV